MRALGLKVKGGLPLFAGALFAVFVVGQASAGYAQSGYGGGGNVDARLGQIENQIQTLSRSVYRGAPPPEGGIGVAGGTLAADYEVRLAQIEEQMRTLTGQLEQAAHQAQDAQARLERLQADYDMRLQQLERGGAVSGAYTGSGVVTAAPPPQQDSVVLDTAGTLGTLSSSGSKTDSPGAMYEEAFGDVRAARYDQAEAKFKDFLQKFPGNTLAGNAQYWLAETYYVRADYKKAARSFAQGYQEYPKSPKAPDSLLKLGLSLSKMGRKEDACLSLQQLRKEFPGDNVPAGRRAVQEIKSLGCAG